MHTRAKRLFAIAVLVAAAVVAPPATASRAAASIDWCNLVPSRTNWFYVGDLELRVCWDWHWVGSDRRWRPDALFVESHGEGWKDYYLRVFTNTSNNPDDVYLKRKLGNASWGVPAAYDWDMTSGVETTTTYVARLLPWNTEACTARIRHDRNVIFVIDFLGKCV